MKKTFTLTILLSMLASVSFAQYRLTYDANMLRPGDYRNMKQIEYSPQGEAGENLVWDFSKSAIVKDMYINQESDLTNCSTEGYRLSCDEGGQKNTLFEITPSEKKYFGMVSANTNIRFEEPIVDLFFPMSYGDAKIGSMVGTYETQKFVGYIDGSYITKADAYGTLILPDGNVYYNTLRVKVEKKYTQDFNNTKYDIHTIRYQYFTEGARYPVLIAVESNVTSDCNCKCGNSTSKEMYMETPAVYGNDAIKNVTVRKGGEENIADFNYLVTPNPFADVINVSLTCEKETEISIDILDMDGKIIKPLMNKEIVKGQKTFNFNVSSLQPGKYALRIITDGKSYTNKLLKAER
jgi:hypothetical protein